MAYGSRLLAHLEVHHGMVRARHDEGSRRNLGPENLTKAIGGVMNENLGCCLSLAQTL